MYDHCRWKQFSMSTRMFVPLCWHRGTAAGCCVVWPWEVVWGWDWAEALDCEAHQRLCVFIARGVGSCPTLQPVGLIAAILCVVCGAPWKWRTLSPLFCLHPNSSASRSSGGSCSSLPMAVLWFYSQVSPVLLLSTH